MCVFVWEAKEEGEQPETSCISTVFKVSGWLSAHSCLWRGQTHGADRSLSLIHSVCSLSQTLHRYFAFLHFMKKIKSTRLFGFGSLSYIEDAHLHSIQKAVPAVCSVLTAQSTNSQLQVSLLLSSFVLNASQSSAILSCISYRKNVGERLCCCVSLRATETQCVLVSYHTGSTAQLRGTTS